MADMELNRKVYVITQGSYSDYHICAVTLDKSRAENMKKLFDGRWDYAQIEEYILDETKENGNLYYIEFPDDSEPTIHIDEYDGFGQIDSSPYVADWNSPIRIYVRTKDEAHAMKIAQDEYARWKAEKEGIT